MSYKALHSACDSDSDILEQRQKQFPDVNYTQSLPEILSNPEIKAVMIAAPAIMHFEFTRLALEAGKDVFVEKPLALTVREGEELVRLAEKNNKILMVGHILQYHPAVNQTKRNYCGGSPGQDPVYLLQPLEHRQTAHRGKHSLEFCSA